MRRNPHLYELNALLFTRRLAGHHGTPVTLADVPQDEWRRLANRGFDLVWLMGVWQRSPGARQKALIEPALHRHYDKALPGWTEKDVAGSPYAVYSYTLDPALGSEGDLSKVRSQLNSHGLGLILDFVPNHLALDHPWTASHPQYFVQGKRADVHAHPDWFFQSAGGLHLAHGRDPYFPPWSDTVQVNFYSPELREALIGQMLRIAEVSDGVRCDMAMLGLNEVFERIWGETLRSYRRPDTEFWTEAIARVRQRWPYFLFLAEAYWGFEPKLQELGFDFTYDKAFYDSLRFSTPRELADRLKQDVLRQQHSVRFVENHDENRAATAFGRERSMAAATMVATIPGLRLFHDGQLEGRRVRLPVQLGREPEEDIDAGVLAFYQRLLTITNAAAFHEGAWCQVDAVPAWEGNGSNQNLLSWTWRYAEQFKVVVVNYSQWQSQGWLKKLPLPRDAPPRLVFYDEMAGVAYVRDTAALRNEGLYIDLEPHKAHLFDVAAE